MSDYTKSTNFATKDNLTPGDPLKIVRGTEIDTEFNNIATAIATKTDNASAAITGGSITGITDLAIADGGTGASTANAALNNLLPSQASASGKYLKSNGTDSSWDALDISTADITGTLPVANGGTGVTSSTGTGSVVLSNSPTLVTPALGTPASGVATNITGLPISTGVSGLGTGVATALAVNVGSAGAPLVNGGVLGTPSSGTATNLTGLPLTTGVTGTLPIANGGTGQTTANAAFNALAPSQATASGKYLKSDGTNTSWDALDISTADITGTLPVANGGTGVTTSTGTGNVVLSNSPTLVTPALGTPSSGTLTNATGLPISTGVSGLGTGVATALAVNVGSAGAPVVNGGALGTPSSGTVTNLTGTASININGTVGATTPTTGAFTTVAASSSVTLSGGTANGVTYLNGSKVLTTGSALTFDGTSLAVGSASAISSGRIGAVGDLTAVNGLVLRDSATTYANNDNFVLLQNSTGATAGGLTHPAASSLGVWGNDDIRFLQSGAATEQMRLTSTGLGIGTSSPGSKLQVGSSANESVNATISYGSSATGSAQRARLWLTNQAITAGFGLEMQGDNNALLFNYLTGGTPTERMRLDSSGNLGLGVTPSAWGANSSAMQLGRYGSVSGNASTGGAYLSSNAILSTDNDSTGWVYKNTDTASYYTARGNTHKWFIAPSGTAGTGITFTQAMTLDASGYLLVGTTSSPSQQAVIYRTSATTSNGALLLDGNGNYAGLQFASSGTLYGSLAVDSSALYLTHNSVLTFRTGASTNVGGTERARIDSSGNLGVGTTSPSTRLHIAGATSATSQLTTQHTGSAVTTVFGCDGAIDVGAVYVTTNHPLAFKTNNTERARIDSSGRLLVGLTSANTSGSNFQVSSGVTFPATQSASSDANTLDDYEEGTWTGTVSDGTNNATMSSNTGYYTKIGNIVTVTGYFVVSSKGSISGGLRLTGLPFNVFNNNGAYSGTTFGFATNANITAGQAIAGYAELGTAQVNLMLWDATGGTTSLQASEINTNFGFILNISYRVA